MLLVALVVWQQRRDDGGTDDLQLLIVGDSVSYLSAGFIDQVFDPDRTQFVTKPGFTSADLLPLMRDAMAMDDVPAAERDAVIVVVGYNDVRLDEVGQNELAAIAEEASSFRCGVFLTLPARPGGEESTNPKISAEEIDDWNRLVVDTIEPYDNLHVARDWEAVVEDRPASDLLQEDGLHPNDDGRRILAEAYRNSLGRNC